MDRIMSQKEYITAWEHNAKQHYDDGDYAWICEKIKTFKTILEIGCGAGYSTLALAEYGHIILAIDNNPEALSKTKDLLVQHGHKAKIATQYIDYSEANCWLYKIDAVGNKDNIAAIVNQMHIDLILLCNPGGYLDDKLYKHEVELLLQYGFTQDEVDQRYHQNAIPLLHKFALIYAAADVAIKSHTPFLIVERGDEKQAKDILDQIKIDTHMKSHWEASRRISWEPNDGVILSGDDEKNSETIFWSAGVLYRD